MDSWSGFKSGATWSLSQVQLGVKVGGVDKKVGRDKDRGKGRGGC